MTGSGIGRTAGTLQIALALSCAAIGLTCSAADGLQFEAEDCVVNRDAFLLDKAAPNRWTLWTKDSNAQRKWSGGVVLRSPEVKADRATPEDGAPPLHLRLKDLPRGAYDVRLKHGRTLAVSLDGREWRRMEGDIVVRDQRIDGGTFEFWVDDRFAEIKPEHRGASYVDCIYLEPATALVKGVWNGDFESLVAGQPAGWALPTVPESGASGVREGNAHSGSHALQIAIRAHDEKAWSCDCRRSLTVAPGQTLRLGVWAKGSMERAVALTVDGFADDKLVQRLLGQVVLDDAADWAPFRTYFCVPEGVTELRLAIRGTGDAELLVDDVTLEVGVAPPYQGSKVQGWAKARVKEKLDRGVVALRTAQGAYVSWRLLDSDPAGVGFMIYRSTDGGAPVRLFNVPVTKTCDLVDHNPPQTGAVRYRVVPEGGVLPQGETTLAPAVEGTPYTSIRLQDSALVANRVAVGDLDGDGAYDFVLKHPNQSIDPAGMYWKRSPETYKLDAYTGGGRFLWRRDLGWSIEMGVWYSPFIVCDLDGDGRAEVIAKTGEGDPRDAEGKVSTGPEWLTVIDGLSGRDVCRAPWPSRKGFAQYNLASRNQLAVAYLDGKTPCLLALRGTYGRMKVDAYVLEKRVLRKVWSYDNADYPTAYWGQGAHTTRVADVDGDGRDEVLLGSACLDDDGTPLWSTGRGHPDGAHVGHFQPGRPGLQVFYCLETYQTRDGGLCMVDAASGKSLWALGGPTRHVHSGGMCADMDPGVPGSECYGADTDEAKRSNRGWLFAADGTLLGAGVRYGSTQPTIYWDADLQREVFRDRIYDHGGGVLEARPLRGKVVDLYGDWREEIIASAPGELRIYSTTLPAMDRRVCLLQDAIYRSCVCLSSMGYETSPTLSTPPAFTAPNLNLTCLPDEDPPACRIVVSTPPGTPLAGTLTLRTEGPFKVAANRFPISLGPNSLCTLTVELKELPAGKPAQGRILGELKSARETLRGEVWVELSGRPAPRSVRFEAEAFSVQGGGKAQIQPRVGCGGGKAVVDWDTKGHFLEWAIDVPSAGRYQLLARYHASDKVARRLLINGVEVGPMAFMATRGQGNAPADWDEVTFMDGEGKPFHLERGRQTIRLENLDGHGLDLDYLDFIR